MSTTTKTDDHTLIQDLINYMKQNNLHEISLKKYSQQFELSKLSKMTLKALVLKSEVLAIKYTRDSEGKLMLLVTFRF